MLFRSYTLNPGDILFIWPGELHETVANHARSLVGVQFPSVLIQDVTDFAAYQNQFRNFHLIRQHESMEFAQSLQMHLNHMLFLDKNKNTFSGVQSLIALYELFMEFGLQINQSVETTAAIFSTPNTSMEKIRQACSYISDHCTQPLTLSTMADYAGFSSCYFSRLFKRATTYNFIEYLSLQRVKFAQGLLAGSTRPVTEIAYQSGFRSISTFNRAFLTYSGCSPSEYRHYYLS